MHLDLISSNGKKSNSGVQEMADFKLNIAW